MFDLNILEDLIETSKKCLADDVNQLIGLLEKSKDALHKKLIEDIKKSPFSKDWCVSIRIKDDSNLRNRDITKIINQKLSEWTSENEKFKVRYNINIIDIDGFNLVCTAIVL